MLVRRKFDRVHSYTPVVRDDKTTHKLRVMTHELRMSRAQIAHELRKGPKLSDTWSCATHASRIHHAHKLRTITDELRMNRARFAHKSRMNTVKIAHAVEHDIGNFSAHVH